MNKHVYRNKIVTLFAGLILVGGGYYLWHRYQINHPKPVVNIPAAENSGNQVIATPTPNVPGATDKTNSATDLLTPSGNFVNKYKSTMNQILESSCNSTSGATCEISFSMGNVTKTLTAKTVAFSGKEAQVAFASWQWTPSSLGLTPGSWTISATASLNGATKTANSTTLLEVSQ